jgi:hypothetical protein
MRLTWVGTCSLVCAALLVGCPGDEIEGASGSTEASSGTSDDPSATSTSGQTGDTTEPSTGSSTSESSSGSTSGSATDASTGAAGFCDDEPIPGLDSALSILYGDLPPIGGGGTASTTDGAPDDDEIWVRLGNIELSCERPRGDTSCEEGVQKWWITMRIPTDLQMPGEYDFEDLHVRIGSDDGVDCGVGSASTSAGGGGGPSGTVYIDEIGSEGVSGCIVSDDVAELDANGSFFAPNCSR